MSFLFRRHSSISSTAAEDALSSERLDVIKCTRSATRAEEAYAQTITIILAAAKLKKLIGRSSGSERSSVTERKCRAPSIAWEDLGVGAKLGQGAYGVAFAITLKEEHSREEFNEAAVKVLRPEQATSALALADMQSEAMLLSQLNHPHVMGALFVGSHPEKGPFIVTQRLASTLASALPRTTEEVGPLKRRAQVKAWPLVRAVRCAVQLAQALRYCHHEAIPGSKLIHRDLKPDNVGLKADGDVLLFDFGLAKVTPLAAAGAAPGPKFTGQTGSPRYMAPEVALEQPYDEKADVYSFAVLAWQMASHTVPYTGLGGADGLLARVAKGGLRPPLPPKWPAPLRRTLAACWEAEAGSRPSLAEAVPVLEALLRQLEEEGGAKAGKGSTPRRSSKEKKAAAAAAAAAAAERAAAIAAKVEVPKAEVRQEKAAKEAAAAEATAAQRQAAERAAAREAAKAEAVASAAAVAEVEAKHRAVVRLVEVAAEAEVADAEREVQMKREGLARRASEREAATGQEEEDDEAARARAPLPPLEVPDETKEAPDETKRKMAADAYPAEAAAGRESASPAKKKGSLASRFKHNLSSGF
eukprot:Transcript_17566.p1 GENE.Transcript_17566~~Transcript_17566.p1  ORF type:complete len:586 (+),score=253.78 Transcript_17566:103-1860(+)